MTDPLFPTPHHRPHHKLRQAADSLGAVCAGIQSDHEAGIEPARIDWPTIERQTEQALANSTPLPFKVRFHLPALLARQSDPTKSQSLAERTVAHFGADRVAPPALTAALLCWAPLDTPGLITLWRESQPNWRTRRPGATPRPSDWVRRPASRDLPGQLAQQVRATGLLPDALPQPLRSLPMCPLSLSTWQILLNNHPAFWCSRPATELDTWLSTPARPRGILIALTELLLAPHATNLPAFRQAIATNPDLSHRCRVTIRHLGTVRDGQPDTHDLSTPTRRVIDVWNVEHHLERLFNAWGADSDRVAFWRQYKQCIVAVEWFEHRSWLAICIGSTWFVVYQDATQRVIVCTERFWRSTGQAILQGRSYPTPTKLRDRFESLKRSKPGVKVYKHKWDEKHIVHAIETGILR